jgi:hypothetical protein
VQTTLGEPALDLLFAMGTWSDAIATWAAGRDCPLVEATALAVRIAGLAKAAAALLATA